MNHATAVRIMQSVAAQERHLGSYLNAVENETLCWKAAMIVKQMGKYSIGDFCLASKNPGIDRYDVRCPFAGESIFYSFTFVNPNQIEFVT